MHSAFVLTFPRPPRDSGPGGNYGQAENTPALTRPHPRVSDTKHVIECRGILDLFEILVAGHCKFDHFLWFRFCCGCFRLRVRFELLRRFGLALSIRAGLPASPRLADSEKAGTQLMRYTRPAIHNV